MLHCMLILGMPDLLCGLILTFGRLLMIPDWATSLAGLFVESRLIGRLGDLLPRYPTPEL